MSEALDAERAQMLARVEAMEGIANTHREAHRQAAVDHAEESERARQAFALRLVREREAHEAEAQVIARGGGGGVGPAAGGGGGGGGGARGAEAHDGCAD